jgi:Kef-type K+ transport system membrane component KefB
MPTSAITAPSGPVLEFFVLFAVILIGPIIFTRFRLPGLIGLLLGGFAIGPHGLGLIAAGNRRGPHRSVPRHHRRAALHGDARQIFGIEGIVGAFFAGLALNRLVPNEGPSMEHVEFFGTAVFVPVFMVSIGLLLDPGVKPRTLRIGRRPGAAVENPADERAPGLR